MKVAAHPMLVAVALGLLGPNALASEPAEDGRAARGASSARTAVANRDGESSALDDSAVMDALEDESGPYWTRLELVSDEADSWQQDRDLSVD